MCLLMAQAHILSNSGTDVSVLLAPADSSLGEEVRDCWSFPFRDRRIDSCGDLCERFLD